MARVSVIIPTFNREHLLRRSVESVLKQSFSDFQLLVVDDGSDDGTKALIESIEDPGIEYIRHETNRGVSAARNTGVRHSDGEFVAFLDSDDTWAESKLERQVAAFDAGSNRLGAVYTTFRKIDWRYEPEVRRPSGNIAIPILVNNCVGTASTPMLTRRCFEATGGFDEALRSSEDWDLWIRVARDWEFEYLDESLVDYYPQAVSLTSDRKGALRSYAALFEKHADEIASLGPAIRAEHYFYRGRIYFTYRKIFAGSGSMIYALWIDSSKLRDISRYLFVENGRKIRDRIFKKTRPGVEA